jgi:signal peptidase I
MIGRLRAATVLGWRLGLRWRRVLRWRLGLRWRPVLATVRGSSMTPTFTDGQRVWAFPRRRYRVGDVVVFVPPAGPSSATDPPWRIKRICAVGGDPAPSWMPDNLARVPAGTIAVTGDNPISQSSREFGYLPTGAILGRVSVRQRGQLSIRP